MIKRRTWQRQSLRRTAEELEDIFEAENEND